MIDRVLNQILDAKQESLQEELKKAVSSLLQKMNDLELGKNIKKNALNLNLVLQGKTSQD